MQGSYLHESVRKTPYATVRNAANMVLVDERLAAIIIMDLGKSNPHMQMLPLAQVLSQECGGTAIMCIEECEQHNQDQASQLLSERIAALIGSGIVIDGCNVFAPISMYG